MAREHLREETRDSVAQLLLRGPAVALDSDLVRERLESAEFTRAEVPIPPVKRASCRTRLRLQGPRRLILGELQKEAPVLILAMRSMAVSSSSKAPMGLHEPENPETPATQSEMEALIERTAMSPFIREKKDFYAALFDGKGRLVVGSNLPIFRDAIGRGCKAPWCRAWHGPGAFASNVTNTPAFGGQVCRS